MASRWDSANAPDGAMQCYVAPPQTGGQAPGIIVIQHAGGVDEFVRGMCDRFAEEGFTAVAPDLYHREDPDSKDDPMTRMARLRDSNIVRDVNVAVQHAQTLPEIDAARLGITGFCMGGRVTWLMAAHQDAFKAAVVFYGGNIMVPWGDVPAPFELAHQINCPLLGLFGDDDPNPNPEDVAKLDTELTRLGKAHEFHSYAGAGHGFMGVGRPMYREEAAKQAWARCTAWFREHLT